MPKTLFKDMKTAIEDEASEYFLGSVVSIELGEIFRFTMASSDLRRL